MSDEPKAPNDLLIPLTPANEAGEQVAIRQDSTGNVTLGTIGYVKDGQSPPEDAEMIDLNHLAGPVYEVNSVKTGPAKVNSRAYRNNWEGIFGKPKTTDPRPN